VKNVFAFSPYPVCPLKKNYFSKEKREKKKAQNGALFKSQKETE